MGSAGVFQATGLGVAGGLKTAEAPRASALVPSDEVLVRRAQEADSWAAEELVRRYRDRVYAIAFHMSDRDSEAAWDVTQDAFLKVLRNLGKFRGEAGFYTWLYRIVVNTALDRRRKRGRWRKVLAPWRADPHIENGAQDPPHAGPDPLQALSGKELSRDIRQALAGLPEKQRVAFQLKVFEGLKIAEIARILNTAEGTVKSHLFRATRAMRASLKEWMSP